jgi:hypothetical protein
MFIYKDYNFVNYILDLPWNDGLEFYNHCIGRFNDIEEGRLWDLFLMDCQNGQYEGCFEDYKNQKITIAENKKMTNQDAEKEYLRISQNVDKIVELDKKRRKEKSG